MNIVGNQSIGPFGEDAIRANRYHDRPDGDAAGLYVFANEFTNIRENGARVYAATAGVTWRVADQHFGP